VRQPGLDEPVPWVFGREAARNGAIVVCQQRIIISARARAAANARALPATARQTCSLFPKISQSPAPDSPQSRPSY
jgi:hypothetical protein